MDKKIIEYGRNCFNQQKSIKIWCLLVFALRPLKSTTLLPHFDKTENKGLRKFLFLDLLG